HRALSHRPAPFPGPAPGVGLTLRDTQPDQVLPFPFRLLPVMPDTVPEPVSYPAVHFFELALDTGHAEVVDPASLGLFQFPDTLLKRAGCGFAGDGLQLLL